MAAQGEIVLAYVDEAGFSQVHPNRSAWTPLGQRHLIEAKRGKRLNVLAAMLSTGGLISAEYYGATTAKVFSGFLAMMAEEIGAKKIVVIVDNASIHRAAEEAHIIEHLEKVAGLRLYFLPPYCPELNRIEKLWHKMKYCWMTPKCRDGKTLMDDVRTILENFGSIYKLSF